MRRLTINKLKRRLTDRFLDEGNIWDSILTGPLEVRITPMGFVCNHDCIMCFRATLSIEERKAHMKKEKNSINLDDYRRLFKQLPFRTTSVDVTGGGEPLLHPQILPILESIKENGLYGHLMTNGALLTPKLIRRLTEMKWNFIRISFHAGDEESYMKVHGRNDFKKVCQVIRTIIKQRGKIKKYMRVSLLFVVQKANFKKIIDFSSLAERLEVDEIEFDNLIPLQRETILNGKQMVIAKESLKRVALSCQIFNNALEVAERYEKLYQRPFSRNLPVLLSKKRFYGKGCRIVLNSMFITNEGNVWPCCFLHRGMGNIRDISIAKIWSSFQYKELRQRISGGQFEQECFEVCPYGLVAT